MVEPFDIDDRDGIPNGETDFTEPGRPDLFDGGPDPDEFDDLDFDDFEDDECPDCGEEVCECDDLDDFDECFDCGEPYEDCECEDEEEDW